MEPNMQTHINALHIINFQYSNLTSRQDRTGQKVLHLLLINPKLLNFRKKSFFFQKNIHYMWKLETCEKIRFWCPIVLYARFFFCARLSAANSKLRHSKLNWQKTTTHSLYQKFIQKWLDFYNK